MKLKLKNFRCYLEKEFDLPDEGLILLAGPSGSGKSTILKAILYALYGVKAVKKPYSFGATTCSVSLDFLGINIVRTNKPNRLVVNKTLEDEPAQEFINNKFGMDYDNFLVSSYIPQKNNSSILSLSQTDALKIIKNLAFDNEVNEKYKSKIKEMTLESSDILKQCNIEKEFIVNEIEGISENIIEIEFPLQCEKDDTIEETIEKYKESLNEYNNKIRKLITEKEDANKLLQEFKNNENKIELINERMKSITEKLESLTCEKESIEKLVKDLPVDLEEKINTTELMIKFIKTNTEFVELEKQYLEIKNEEILERENKKEKLLENFSSFDFESENEKLDDYESLMITVNQYKQADKDFNKIKKLYMLEDSTCEELCEKYSCLINDLSTEIKNVEYSSKIINCPECKANLLWECDKLVCTKVKIKNSETDLQDLKKKKEKFEKILKQLHKISFPKEKDLPDYTELKKKITDLSEKISENKNIKEQLERIEFELSEEYTYPSLKGLLKKKVDRGKLLQKLKKYENELDIDEQQNELFLLKEQLKNNEQNENTLAKLNNEISKLEISEKKYKKEINSLINENVDFDENEIVENISTLETEIQDVKKQQDNDESKRQLVHEYVLYSCRKEELNKWEKKLKVNIKKVKEAENIHSAHLVLKDRFNEAEIRTLISIINSINEHTQYYLKEFFTDDDISAELSSVYKGKKIQTLKIDTKINYKGYEYDSINQLSGGEFDRISLSSICGINNMLNSPILILDESLSSLDENINTEIFRFLKELAKDKLILVCSHEALNGVFDKVKELALS